MLNSPQTAAGHVLAAYASAGRGGDAMKNAHSSSPPIPFQLPGAPISNQKVKIQKHQIAVAQREPLAPKFPQLPRLLLVAGYPHYGIAKQQKIFPQDNEGEVRAESGGEGTLGDTVPLRDH